MASSRLEDTTRLLSSEVDDSDGVEHSHQASPSSSEDNNDPDSDSGSIRTMKGPYDKDSDGDHDSPTSPTTSTNSSHRKRRSSFLRSSAPSSSRLSVATYSIWSTNMTMSNLVGAGRTLGNLYSFAGRRLERGILRLLARTWFGPDACADRLEYLYTSVKFSTGQPFSDFPEDSWWGRLGPVKLFKLMGPDCEQLLRYGAATNLPDVQLIAFRRILDLVTGCPPLRHVFKACCESRNSLIDLEAVMFAWKKSVNDLDINSYNDEWLSHFRLATLCLGKNDVTAVVDELSYLSWSKERSEPLAALVKLCLANGDLGELAKSFLIGYILEYNVPRSAKSIGSSIRFWEDMLELDQSAHDNLVQIFEQMGVSGNDFNSDACARTQELASVLLMFFWRSQDAHFHIRYAHKAKDVRAFLTVWRIINLDCIRRKANFDVASIDWRTWLASKLDLCKVRFDVPPFDHVMRMAPLSSTDQSSVKRAVSSKSRGHRSQRPSEISGKPYMLESGLFKPYLNPRFTR
ncbi:hypothetical protein SCHPADRAFT_535721 [Schizopora paradoxa]|uniref:Uncharacterized protein n=1 Tax=Schizopora paradoxa TaxID=27342 RepID=A0A0H2RZ96_9AGAM|nr:hypothetical protein SCHPADRAFT_535721 [Schizopora paradoxa]